MIERTVEILWLQQWAFYKAISRKIAVILISSLSESDLGCHINGVYIGCLVYADDIILLSASVVHLQMMLDICYSQAVELDIKFNAKKSALFVVGNTPVTPRLRPYCDCTATNFLTKSR